MKTIDLDTFKRGINRYFEELEQNEIRLNIVSEKGKGVVLLPVKEYYSLKETLYLLGSRKNALRLYESLDQLRRGGARKVDGENQP